MPSNGTGVAITNPLVLYRSLVATNRIRPDPAQHRLAIHLQKLYDSLKDYEPTIEYSQRLAQISRSLNIPTSQDAPPADSKLRSSRITSFGTRGLWPSLLVQKEKRDTLALTRVLTSHEAALQLDSPKGLMLHGEVGTGKSMLIDLFADCLPTRKKRRWHFNTFMLDTFSRLEALRRSRDLNPVLSNGMPSGSDEYSLLWLARDLIEKSPILFLDEFQLPDRAASKILSNLLTSFFQLGGVLVATSNRMPEELAKAAGMEFSRPVSRLSRLGWRLGLGGTIGRDDGPGQKGEFAMFLEVLRARCEVWEMEGKSDYRRAGGEDVEAHISPESGRTTTTASAASTVRTMSEEDVTSTLPPETSPSYLSSIAITDTTTSLPKNYLVQSSPAELSILLASLALPPAHAWTPTTLSVYGRKLPIPRTHAGYALFTFSELCGATLGPADYVTLASTFHTVLLTDIPVLGFLQKNEARRLITLLDALYEARCRLFVTAAAGPDSIFFPEPAATETIAPGSKLAGEEGSTEALVDDAVYPETYSEIHQDLTSPFRPNVSVYGSSSTLAEDALEDDPPNRFRRPGSSYTDERRLPHGSKPSPDFSNVGGLTGEDERFAVKRAESRLWEMCSARWWERGADAPEDSKTDVPSWWRPLPLESRHWERSSTTSSILPLPSTTPCGEEQARRRPDEKLFAHGASPFRTSRDPPPKMNWTHVWGTMRWGKRAGTWGKGIEGLEERRAEKARERVEEGTAGHERERKE